MPVHRTDIERRRRAFLHALGSGRSVVEAADHAGIGWSTLYAWRHNAPAFRAAWDRAAARARDALADRMRAALIERAVVGVDEPVFHNGERVGTRKRYSDLLLLAGLRETMAPAAAAADTTPPRPVVVIRNFRQEREDEEREAALASARRIAAAPATPALAASEPPPLSQPPAPAEPAPDKPLCWAHLGRRDDV